MAVHNRHPHEILRAVVTHQADSCIYRAERLRENDGSAHPLESEFTNDFVLWLFGSGFDVTSLTKEDDFDAAVTANYIVAFDNVDGKIDWLNDKLAHTATGKMIQKRELYTTNRNIRFFPKCFLMLNARTPAFKRDDVTDRLLLFRTEPILALRSEAEIITEVMKKRNEIWSDLLNDLNEIVSSLANKRGSATALSPAMRWIANRPSRIKYPTARELIKEYRVEG